MHTWPQQPTNNMHAHAPTDGQKFDGGGVGTSRPQVPFQGCSQLTIGFSISFPFFFPSFLFYFFSATAVPATKELARPGVPLLPDLLEGFYQTSPMGRFQRLHGYRQDLE